MAETTRLVVDMVLPMATKYALDRHVVEAGITRSTYLRQLILADLHGTPSDAVRPSPTPPRQMPSRHRGDVRLGPLHLVWDLE